MTIHHSESGASVVDFRLGFVRRVGTVIVSDEALRTLPHHDGVSAELADPVFLIDPVYRIGVIAKRTIHDVAAQLVAAEFKRRGVVGAVVWTPINAVVADVFPVNSLLLIRV